MSFWKTIFASAAERQHYSLPPGILVYAIGDIHGRLDLLKRLLDKIHRDRATRAFEGQTYIVFLGDYVDRGFESREVLDCLSTLEEETDLHYIFLAGNHEDMMLGFLDDPLDNQLWLKVGGIQTLVSYGVAAPSSTNIKALVDMSEGLAAALPARHLEFLQSLKTWWRAGGYLFVHAGVRPGKPLEEQKRQDLLGIRQDFTTSAQDFGFRVVHGHTGVPDVAISANRIAVDTGAFATGKLSAISLWGDSYAVLST